MKDLSPIDGDSLLDRLADGMRHIRGRLTPDYPMAKLTWFQVGGAAELLFQPEDEEDLAAFLAALPAEVPVMVVGVGSNLLVRDGGVKGVVIRLPARGFGGVERLGENRLKVGAALPDKRLAAAALDAGLAGFHFYHGIPGAVGGALRMNAGANGVETTDRVIEVIAYDRQGERHVLSHDDMGYAYRHSSAPADYIFTHAVFEGPAGEAGAIQAAMDEVQTHRETVQPIREKTGGSTFKNPQGTSAWKCVDAAGCRGLIVGDAQMSEMHCNFMINRGAATAHDLEMLGETVRRRVRDGQGIELHWEIKRIGRFEPGREVQPFLGDE